MVCLPMKYRVVGDCNCNFIVHKHFNANSLLFLQITHKYFSNLTPSVIVALMYLNIFFVALKCISVAQCINHDKRLTTNRIYRSELHQTNLMIVFSFVHLSATYQVKISKISV